MQLRNILKLKYIFPLCIAPSLTFVSGDNDFFSKAEENSSMYRSSQHRFLPLVLEIYILPFF